MCVYTFKYMCVYIHTHTHTQVYICIPAYMYTNKYMGMCVSVYIYMYIYISARPYESCKNVKGLAPLPWDAPSELVQLWYKTFPPDHDGRVEMKTPTRLSNKTSTA